MKFIIASVVGLAISSAAVAQSKLSCTAFVYGEMPFITIEMTVQNDGHIERLANLIHQGVSRQTAIEENSKTADQLYNLTVEADHPGQELFLEINKPKDGDTSGILSGQLINPASPAYKTMRASCERQ